MNRTLIALLSIFSIFSMSSMAATHIYDTTITKVFAHETDNNGTVYFGFENMKNPDSCAKSGSIALTKDNAMESEILSIGLAAYMSKLNVGYTIDGCTGSGNPRLKNLWID